MLLFLTTFYLWVDRKCSETILNIHAILEGQARVFQGIIVLLEFFTELFGFSCGRVRIIPGVDDFDFLHFLYILDFLLLVIYLDLC